MRIRSYGVVRTFRNCVATVITIREVVRSSEILAAKRRDDVSPVRERLGKVEHFIEPQSDDTTRDTVSSGPRIGAETNSRRSGPF